MPAQHKSRRFILQIPRRRDETRVYVRRVSQRDIKSKIHSANEMDPPDKGIKEQDVNKGDTTNGSEGVNKLAVDGAVDKADVYLIYWPRVGGGVGEGSLRLFNCDSFRSVEAKHLLRPIRAALMTSSVCPPHSRFQQEHIIEITLVKNSSIWAFQGAGLLRAN